MSLVVLIDKHRVSILKKCEARLAELSLRKSLSHELKRRMSVFLGQLHDVLDQNVSDISIEDEERILHTAGTQGEEFLASGYSLSHVVHAYGSLCQSITRIAMDAQVRLSAEEFHILNSCLDVAIAGAATNYEASRGAQLRALEVEHLENLAHSLRNALSRAMIASELIRTGVVSTEGRTSSVLQASLSEMGELLDKAFLETGPREKD